jgi:hypothetical protein
MVLGGGSVDMKSRAYALAVLLPMPAAFVIEGGIRLWRGRLRTRSATLRWTDLILGVLLAGSGALVSAVIFWKCLT